MPTFPLDIKQALRSLSKAPGFTLAVLLTLALGIGANASVFSLLDQALWKPLPFKDPDALVIPHESILKQPGSITQFSAPNFLDFRRQTTAFSGMAGFKRWNVNLSGEGLPEVLRGGMVSANFFEVLGVDPVLGRTFRAGEDVEGASRVVVLSHELWQRRFGGAASVLGRSLRLDGEDWQVLGVLPTGFRFPYRLGDLDLYFPLAFEARSMAPEARGDHFFSAVARLKRGATPEQGAQDMARVMAGLAQAFPDSCTGYGAGAKPLRQVALPAARKNQMLMLQGVAGLVLLIACVNVANLLLARGLSRRQEWAIRASLGAARSRLVGPLMAESLLLAVGGGILGLLVSTWITQGLLSVVGLPLGLRPEVSGSTLPFMGGLTLLTCLLCGALPAWQATRGDLTHALHEGSKGTSTQGTHRLRSALVVGELALATALLVTTGLMLRSLWRLQNLPLGFQPRQVMTGTLYPPDTTHDGLRNQVFSRTLVQRLNESPSVVSSAVTDTLPLGDNTDVNGYGVEGEPPLPPGQFQSAYIHRITPGFLETLEVPLLAGRDFTWSDGPATCLISEPLARAHFPGGSPLGRRLRIGDGPWMEIVGLVATTEQGIQDKRRLPHIYQPLKAFTGPLQVVARARREALSLKDLLPSTARALDADLPMTRILPMEGLIHKALENDRSQGALMAAFGAVALALALVGIYGLMAFLARSRTRELGIRAALGATLSDLLALVLGQGLRLVALGLGLGLLSAALVGRGLASQFQGVSGLDVGTYAAVTGLLGCSALLACLLPALHAARVDPAVALRNE
ncbi:MAG: ABC transporter permease [Acidobacteria bacterium]|nr:ABC transporter permease [Acidobacteriota bacterium]